jgi:hypothetical protein
VQASVPASNISIMTRIRTELLDMTILPVPGAYALPESDFLSHFIRGTS